MTYTKTDSTMKTALKLDTCNVNWYNEYILTKMLRTPHLDGNSTTNPNQLFKPEIEYAVMEKCVLQCSCANVQKR